MVKGSISQEAVTPLKPERPFPIKAFCAIRIGSRAPAPLLSKLRPSSLERTARHRVRAVVDPPTSRTSLRMEACRS